MQCQEFLFLLLVSLHVLHVVVSQGDNGNDDNGNPSGCPSCSCENGVRKNPCEGACGTNSVCHAQNNTAVCMCKANYIGDPIKGCVAAPKVCGCKTLISQDEGCPSDRFPIPMSTSSAEEDQMFKFMLMGKGRISILLHTSLNQMDNETYIIELTTSEAKILKSVNFHTKKTMSYTSVEPEVLISTAKTTEFWIKITPEGYIQVGKMGVKTPFIVDQNPHPLRIKTFSLIANEDNVAIMYYDCDNDECKRQKDCPPNNICADGVCKNPCDNACGKNTVCNVSNYAAVCTCQEKYIGNPLKGCDPDPDTCKKNKDCPESSVCVDGTCMNVCANACGKHTTCNVQNNVPICTCQDNYYGNPLQGCDAQKHFKCKTLVGKRDGTGDWYSDPHPIPASTNSSGEDLLFEFMLKGTGAVISLNTSPVAEEWDLFINLGINKNNASMIWKNSNRKTEVETKDILHATKMRGFWIRMTAQGDIQVGKEGGKLPFMELWDPEPLQVKYFGFLVYDVGDFAVMNYDCSTV